MSTRDIHIDASRLWNIGDFVSIELSTAKGTKKVLIANVGDAPEWEVTYSYHPRPDNASFSTCDLCGVRIDSPSVRRGWSGEVLGMLGTGYQDKHTAWHQRLGR